MCIKNFGDEKIRKSLISDLISSFSKGRGFIRKDTKIETKEGQKSARAIGKPDLIYRFLDLANSRSIWNSKYGKTSEESKPDIEKLIPKIYRYRFDHSDVLSSTMDSLWNSLVQDSDKAIERNFQIIMKDLVKV